MRSRDPCPTFQLAGTKFPHPAVLPGAPLASTQPTQEMRKPPKYLEQDSNPYRFMLWVKNYKCIEMGHITKDWKEPQMFGLPPQSSNVVSTPSRKKNYGNRHLNNCRNCLQQVWKNCIFGFFLSCQLVGKRRTNLTLLPISADAGL